MFSPISSEKRRNSIGLGELVAGTELAFQVPIFNGANLRPLIFTQSGFMFQMAPA